MRFCFCAFVARGSSVNRRKIVQNSTKIHPRPTQNRRKIDLEPFRAPKPFRGRVRTRSGRLLDAQMPAQSRSWGAPGEPRAARSRPKASPGTPKTLQDPPDGPSERLRSTERLRTRLRIDFWLVLSCCAKTPMCLAYQFLQCFVGFARSSHRTCMSADKLRKPSHFALQHRSRERPRDPKSSPSDPGRAKKHVRSARGASEKFLVSANEPTSSEMARPVPPKSARSPEGAEGKFRNLRMDF